jgi:hypothetical protein
MSRRPDEPGGSLEVTSRVLVRAEPGRLWQAAMDWGRQGDWMLATRVQGGQGVGARVVARTGVGPIGFTDTMVVTQWYPPRRCVVRHTGRVVRGTGVFEVTQRGADSEFAWTERLRLPWPASGRLGQWLIAPPARWLMDLSLRRFTRLF